MSTVITIAQDPQQVPHAHPVLQLRTPSPDYRAAHEELKGMMARYEEETDELSDVLFDWCHKFHEYFNQDRSAESIYVFAQERLRELRHEILINEFDVSNPDPQMRRTLIKPMTDRGWVWEEAVLKNYLKLSRLSPFDQKPIDAKVHQFALAMLDWSKKIYVEPRVEQQPNVDLHRQIDAIDDEMQRLHLTMRYQCVAQNILRQGETRKIRREMVQRGSELQVLRSELHRVNENIIRLAEQAAQEELQRARNNIKEIENAHNQAMRALQNTYNIAESRIQVQESHLQEMQNRIVALNQQLAEMQRVRAQLIQQIAALRRK